MKTDDYIIGLRKNHGITISLENGELKIVAAQKALTKEVVRGIKTRKEEIITFFESVSRNGTSHSIPLAPRQPHYKASSAQKRLFFINELDKTSLAYHLPLMMSLKGTLELEKLDKALNQLIRRHESLRTSFKMIKEEVYQTIAGEATVAIERFEGTAKETKAIFKKFVRPFELSKGPLIRVGIIPLAPLESVLMIDLHHIICDGISQRVFIKDFMALYNEEPLPELAFQYKDYVAWQQTEGQQKALAQNKEYWLSEFSDEIQTLNLPVDFTRPPRKNYEGATIQFEIGQRQTKALKNLTEAEGTTLFTVLLSVFYVLLAKLSNQEDIVVGTPVGGRQHEDLEPMIGMFVNTLPLRNYPQSEAGFVQFLSAVKTNIQRAFDNQAVQYESLISDLNLERDTSRNPLFDVMFSFQNMEEVTLKIPGLILEPILNSRTESKFDLTLTAHENGDGISLNFEYSTRLFKARTIERFIAYFNKLVSVITANPSVELGTIEILTEAEKEQILHEFNRPQVEYRGGESVMFLFEQQARLTPENTALFYDDFRLSYSELDALSNKLAAYLREVVAVKKGDLVGVLLEREAYLIPSIFGILKAGAVYVPIDPNYPEGRIQTILENSSVKTLITRGRHIDSLSQQHTAVLDLDKSLADIEAYKSGLPPIQVAGSDLAYIIHTSGSIGKPKGVMIEHHSVVNRLLWMQNEYPIKESDTILQKTPIVFDVSVWELFWWSFTGASLYLLKPGEEKEPQAMIEAIAQHKVTTMHFVPSMLQAFLTALDQTYGANKLESLKQVFTSGEALKAEQVNLFGQLIHKAHATRLINLYGPTEATVDVSHYECDFANQSENDPPIGKPIDNTSLYVLSRDNQLVPVGVEGELHIGGVNVARGYLNDPAQSSEKFITDPITGIGRLYKTGDLVKWLPDGNVAYLGRIDHQVKVKGFRIELGEIESHLLTHQRVEEAVVVAKEKGEDKFLVAYYVSSEPLEVSQLRSHLSERLPVYMVPADFVQLSALPLTANGKLNRKALPEPVLQATEIFVEPQTREEQLLAEVWSDVLGLESIGVTDNFFSVGGDSIKSIQISSRMRNAGYEVTVQNIFTHQTIRQLAPNLKALITVSDQSTVVGTASVSPIQRWLLEGPFVGKHHYNQSVLLNFPEGLGAKEAKLLFERIQLHHDALRMTFRQEDGEWLQENKGPEIRLSIEERDLRGRADAFEELLTEAHKIQAGIDLAKGPLMKLGLFHMHEGSHLLVVIHHLVMDGVSWRILFEDLEMLYEQYRNEEAFSLPLKTDAYLAWPSKLQDYTNSVAFQKARQYWDELQLGAVPSIVRDNPDAQSSYDTYNRVSLQLTEEKTLQLLTEVNAAFHTQINDILLAALWLSIHKQYGLSAVAVDLEGHGREAIHPDVNINRTIGWFTSIYPVLLSSDSQTLPELIKQVKESLRQVPNQGFDYLLYSQHFQTQETAGAQQSSRIMFNYLGQLDTDTQGRTFLLSSEPHGTTRSPADALEYDWSISGMVKQGRLEMSLMYGPEQYQEQTVNAFIQHYKESLHEIIDYCLNSDKAELTPSDLTYKGLSITQLDDLQKKRAIDDIYTLSPMQEGMLFHSLLDNESVHYYGQLCCDINGPLNITALEDSVNELIRRYDVLRTTFLHEDYELPLQVVLKERKVDFTYEDLRDQPEAGKVELVETYRQKEASRKFDLSTDVLMRLTILQSSDTRHTLIWSYHHVLMDGWCMSIIFDEFRTLYTGKVLGRQLSLAPVKRYADYIAWLEEQDKAAALDYWKHYLGDYENLATIPGKVSHLNRQQEAEIIYDYLRLEQDFVKSFGTISKNLGVTINTIIQTAWGLLLAKYNDTQDVVFGAVVSGRPAEVEGIESMVGLFINTIPVRISYQRGDTAPTLLKSVQEKAIASEPYHYSPLAKVQGFNDLGRGLLDHILVFENVPVGDAIANKATKAEDPGHLNTSNIRSSVQTSYDLTLVVVPGEEMLIRFEYNSKKYDQATIRQVQKHLKSIIGQLVAHCEAPAKQQPELIAIDMLSEAEKHQLLNNDQINLPVERTFPDLFKEQVRQTPDQIALRFENETLSYAALDKYTNQLADVLIKRGLIGNKVIGIFMERSMEMVCGMLAILKAGGAYLPMDIRYPEERINYMIENSGMDMLLTTAEFKEKLSYNLEVICVEEASESEQVDSPNCEISPSDLCYIIYTSGSTGKPKGVMVEHRNLANYISWGAVHYLNGEKMSFPLYSSASFDLTVTSIFLPLITGNEIVIYKGDDQATLIQEVIKSKQVDIIKLTPSHLKLLSGAALLKPDYSRLKKLIVGGEELETDLALEVYDQLAGQVEIYNEYGPTEATVGCMIYQFDPDDRFPAVPIGRAIDNNRVYLLDKQHQLVAPGVEGELYISGVGVARGYLGNEALTAERFLEDPFVAGAIMYKTGDVGKWLTDGTMLFAGRKDEQVKLRGYRIELGEINHQLSSYESIRESVVVLKTRVENRDNFLVAYYLSDEAPEVTPLKNFLSERLPDYMVPTHYQQLEAWPLTTNGKLDTKSLPDPEFKTAVDHSSAISEIEKTLLSIWMEVLGVEDLGVTDDFFSAGGDSIKLILIGSKLRKAGYKASVQDIFDNPTIRQLANYLVDDSAPANQVEKTLVKIWSDVLGVEGIGVTDDFFSAGGDSIKLILIGSKLRKEGIEVSIQDIFDNPTIRQLATKIDTEPATKGNAYGALTTGTVDGQNGGTHNSEFTYKDLSTAQIDQLQARYAIEDIYPLSPLQEGLLFHSLLGDDSGNYLQQLRCDIEGTPDIAALEYSMNELIRRYDVLRTAFLHEGYQRSLQVVLQERKVDFTYLDLREKTHLSKEEHIAQYKQKNAVRKFDLQSDVLMRLAVLQTSDTEHTLIWSHHHVLMDGWCMSIIFHEFTSFYKQKVLGARADLPRVKKYADYISWLEKQDKSAGLDYWKDYLSGYENGATLPAKTSWSSVDNQAFELEARSLTLDKELTESLHRLTRSEGITLNTIIQTAWAILLSKYNNTRDVVFGAVVSGRPMEIEGVETMVGLFINTIPVRVSFEEQDSIHATLKSVQKKAIETAPHHYSPLAQVQTVSEMGRSLLDHIIIFENVPLGEEIAQGTQVQNEVEDFRVTNVEINWQTNYDLTLVVFPKGELEVKFEYNTRKYDAALIDQVMAHLRTIIEQIVVNDKVPLKALDILSKNERLQILTTFNNTSCEINRDDTFITRFLNQVAFTPANIAVSHKDAELSYKDLYERAAGLSACLQSKGLGSHKHVALFMPRSIDMLTSVLAVFHAGGAYVPIDVNYPESRITDILRNSETEVVIVQRAYAGQLEAIRSTLPVIKDVLVIDELDLETYEVIEPVMTSPEDTSYIIYTSGTTGKPKGVMVKQLGMVNHLLAKIQGFNIGEKDIVAQTASPCFDISVWQFLSALLVGGTTHIIDTEVVLDASELSKALEKGKVTIVQSVPSLLTTFLDGLPKTQGHTLGGVKKMGLIGEALSANLAEKWYAQFPDIILINSYGPTEASDEVTHDVVAPDQQTITIGKPVQNTHIYILDQDLKLCPVGVKGEICIAGLGIGKGYWKNGEKTQAAFLPNPFVGEIDESGYDTLYKTGDIGYFLPDGNIICLGRLDHQVKIRGNRIELGEVQNVLNQADEINDAAVVAKGEGADKYLVAYYVSEVALDIIELRSHLLAKLPDYMVPSHFMHLAELPLLHSGKLDRKALPAPELQAGKDHVAPETECEKILATTWSEVLGVEGIGVTDSFFAVGGDSIKSIQISSRLREAGYEVSIKDIFTYQTVRQLAPVMKALPGITAQPNETDDPAALASGVLSKTQLGELEQQYDLENVYPLSPMQEGMLFHSLLDTDSGNYFQQMRCDLEGELDITALEQSMNALIMRYDVLRTAFFHDGYDRSFQVVMKARQIDFTYLDLRDNLGTDKEVLIEQYRKQDASCKFDLQEDVLMRLTVLQTADTEHSLIWSHHHVLMDGWCMSIIINEFRALYGGQLTGRQVSLPPVQPYSTYISWLEQQDQLAASDYWKACLTGYDNLATIPARSTWSPLDQSAVELETNHLVLDKEFVNSLSHVSENLGVTLNTIVQTAWAILLGRYNNTNDVVFGAVVSGRPSQIQGVENMVGLFINTIPVRVSFKAKDTLEQLLKETQKRALDSDAYHYSPLAQVQTLSEMGRGLLDHIMIFENYPIGQHIAQSEKNRSDNKYFNVRSVKTYEQTNYDLTLWVYPGEETEIKFEYNARKYDPAVIEQIKTHFHNILKELAIDADMELSRVNILDSAERHQLLNEFNNTRYEFTTEHAYMPLFRRQVQVHSLSMAVVHNGTHLSYQDLYERAARLSACLRSGGLNTNKHIALYMPRSIDMLIGILAAFHAGAAYVPIDVNYPAERVRDILSDSEAEMVILQQEYAEKLDVIKPSIESLKRSIVIDELNLESFAIEEPITGSPEDTAYVIYTSGTTGKPKGVMVKQQGMVNHLFAKIEGFEFGAQDTVAQTASPCFDISVWQFLSALLVGGTTRIIDQEDVLNPERLVTCLEEGKVDIVQSVPSLLTSFLDGLPPNHTDTLGQVKKMGLIGEPLSLVLARKWYAHFPGIPLINSYGPTEASDEVTHDVVAPPTDEPQIITIGKPVQNTHIYIVDQHLNLCPIGVKGEICIAGLGVGKGYWKNEEKTKAAFLPNPFTKEIDTQGYNTLYKTGDIGYYQPDGNIICLGRHDHQIKIRGNRIELGEIQNVLNQAEGVKDVAIVAKGDGVDKFLVAYYVSEDELDIHELRSHLMNRLPDYMIPSYFKHLSELPLLSNGKLDRKSLPDPDKTMEENLNHGSNALEEKLVEIWSEVLSIDQQFISTTRSFFEMGGHSIKVFQISRRIQEEFSVSLKLTDVFANPSVGELAQLISGMDKGDVALISRAPQRDFYAASAAQERMYFQHLLHQESTAFNISITVEIKGDVSIERLEQTFQTLINRHEGLRTSFILLSDGLTQKVNDQVSFNLEILNGSYHDGVSEACRAFVRPFDLSQESLLRAGLFRNQSGNFLLVDIHHIVSDRRSLEVLMDDFNTVYFNGELQPLELRYVDYAHWLSGDKARLHQQEAFWSEKLSGPLPRTDLPLIQEREDVDTRQVAFHELEIKGSVYEAIQALTADQKVSEYMLMLSIYYILLHKMSGESDVIIGTEVLGRSQPGLQNIVGTFVNILPLRLQAGPDKRYIDFLMEVKTAVLEAFEHQDFQFDQMVSLVEDGEQDPLRNPVFDFYFSFANAATGNTETEDLKFVHYDLDKRVRGEYEFTIDVAQRSDKLTLTCIYSSELYDEETITLLMVYYRNILTEVLRNQARSIEDIEMEDVLDQTT